MIRYLVRAWLARRGVLALTVAVLAGSAVAEVPVTGSWLAERACPAFQSLRNETNPGGVLTAPGVRYEALALNRPGGRHLRVLMPGVPGEDRRWVPLDCGRRIASEPGQGRVPGPERATIARETTKATETVLAISWQPAFCEIQTRRPECVALNGDSSDPAGTRFSLHGLWPEPSDRIYCGVPEALEKADRAGAWRRLPTPELDAQTQAALRRAMPGVRSDLHRHQWVKHGSCYGASGFSGAGADAYFDDAVWLLEQVNASEVRALFQRRIGYRLEAREVRAAFDAAFGAGAGGSVGLRCVEGMIVELRLSLRGRIEAGETSLGDLLRAARGSGPGCSAGRVDRAGL
jgi:ribonuclease T2